MYFCSVFVSFPFSCVLRVFACVVVAFGFVWCRSEWYLRVRDFFLGSAFVGANGKVDYAGGV